MLCCNSGGGDEDDGGILSRGIFSFSCRGHGNCCRCLRGRDRLSGPNVRELLAAADAGIVAMETCSNADSAASQADAEPLEAERAPQHLPTTSGDALCVLVSAATLASHVIADAERGRKNSGPLMPHKALLFPLFFFVSAKASVFIIMFMLYAPSAPLPLSVSSPPAFAPTPSITHLLLCRLPSSFPSLDSRHLSLRFAFRILRSPSDALPPALSAVKLNGCTPGVAVPGAPPKAAGVALPTPKLKPVEAAVGVLVT